MHEKVNRLSIERSSNFETPQLECRQELVKLKEKWILCSNVLPEKWPLKKLPAWAVKAPFKLLPSSQRKTYQEDAMKTAIWHYENYLAFVVDQVLVQEVKPLFTVFKKGCYREQKRLTHEVSAMKDEAEHLKAQSRSYRAGTHWTSVRLVSCIQQAQSKAALPYILQECLDELLEIMV